MNLFPSPFRLLVPLILLLGATSCGVNKVPSQEEAVKASWAEVQNQYQRRADLIPNLVASVKGFADQEKSVLVAVTQARARVSQVRIDSTQLGNPASVREFAKAQGALSGALGRLLVTVEKYPELKSNQNFLALQSQLEGTENRIAISRRDYNLAVQQYNTTIRTFPAFLAARFVYDAKPIVPFTATTADADKAPQVQF